MQFKPHLVLLATIFAIVWKCEYEAAPINGADRSLCFTESTEVLRTGEHSSTIRCRLLYLEPDFFDQWDYELTDRQSCGQYVLSDLETFFLFQPPRSEVKTTSISMSSGIATVIYDDVAIDGARNRINALWKRNDDPTGFEFVILAFDSSEFSILSPITVQIPSNGSVVVRNAVNESDGKAKFLWMVIRTLHN